MLNGMPEQPLKLKMHNALSAKSYATFIQIIAFSSGRNSFNQLNEEMGLRVTVSCAFSSMLPSFKVLHVERISYCLK